MSGHAYLPLSLLALLLGAALLAHAAGAPSPQPQTAEPVRFEAPAPSVWGFP